jgi:CMP-2-keto-3-deoxyoctulosonic acid synthetase
MQKIIVAAAATAAAAAIVGLAGPAAAAPSGAGSANDAISQLEAQGNRVIVNRLSDAPLAQASVVSVQPGAELSSTAQVVYVDVR